MISAVAQVAAQQPRIDWAVIAAFLVPLISALTIMFGAAAWFVRVQIRLVTSAMEARLQALEKGYAEMSGTVNATALTLARVEGKLSTSPLSQAPPGV